MPLKLHETFAKKLDQILSREKKFAQPEDIAQKEKDVLTCAVAFLLAGGDKAHPLINKAAVYAQTRIDEDTKAAKKGNFCPDPERYIRAVEFLGKLQK